VSVQYKAVLWNRQKRIYDAVLLAGIICYIGLFSAVTIALHPEVTAETILIRALGTAALLLLHIILCIGPLCRLDRRFLPLLYNRRHLGVCMFFLALGHGVFSLVQFHALGDINPFLSVLTSNTRFDSLANFPFQQLGLAALLILFLMAATSHDFWLHTLSPPVWKRLHMLVYVAYAWIVAHVLLGALQTERSLLLAIILAAGMMLLMSLHIGVGLRERRLDATRTAALSDGFVEVSKVSAIPDNCAVVVTLGGERVAVFQYNGRVSAVSNVCRHQNGPLGEGRIIDGCITCPWHGYQYRPEDGCSPPPFTDKVPTYRTRIIDGKVLVHPAALPAGTPVEPSLISASL
jgi:nitrite reductase/ring-hydroxylating ferredoxin subunit/DMSO/TMAO reductase YedYZ heme-binding membrane subunit